MAVQTEDHPLDYADFEGVIPADNYGAGPMILWDRGVYRSFDEVHPREGLAGGKLDIELFGHKLQGRWALVRLRKSEGGKDWLFFKKDDAFSGTTDIVRNAPESVASGLDLEARRDADKAVSRILSTVKGTTAPVGELAKADLFPMLAETRATPFSDPDWIFELKYDGVRAALARTSDGTVHLRSRRGGDYRATFPEIALVGRHLPFPSFAIDGEIIAVEDSGAGSFELLQQRLARSATTAVRVVMYAFDLLHLAGRDLRPLPLGQRKELLREILPPVGPVRFADHIEESGEQLFAAAEERQLEGIVAKRASSAYRTGMRSRNWVKIKIPRIDNLVIVGWQAGNGNRALGSLLLAWLQDGELTYAGNVGSGLNQEVSSELQNQFARLTAAHAEFSAGDLAVPKNAHFVRPQLVARVRYTEVTTRGSLRQPVFLGLEATADWRECQSPRGGDSGVANAEKLEQLAEEPATAPTIPTRTNVEKIFWPEDGYTKGDLLDYYEAAWPHIAIYLKDRPTVLTRYPDGISGKSFFQRNAPEFAPEWVTTARIEDTEYIVCNDLATLMYVINLGCIPLHMWSARHPAIGHPDWAILDLDPKGAPFSEVVRVALHLHSVLDDLSLPSFVKTSGQAGLHLLIPLRPELSHDQAKMFAEVLARLAARELPEICTVARPLRDRGGKTYVDFLQNGEGKTIAAPFCVRPIQGAPVSTPLRWQQLDGPLDPGDFTIATVIQQIEDHGDPMAGILSGGLTPAAMVEALSALHSRLVD